ncbi:MAG: hypothetical protein HQK75_15595 [Candidatus Magnetomorum sp.]|nr:hypothetical protein [Candidatus Magnetomorum sp.]
MKQRYRFLLFCFMGGLSFFISKAQGLDIPHIPLEVLVQSPPPVIMLLIDDSSSMNASILAEPDNTILNQHFYVFNDPENHVLTALTTQQAIIPPEKTGSWQARCAFFNRMYYHPHRQYAPWPHWNMLPGNTGNTSDADMTCPRFHPLKSACLNLDDPYFTHDAMTLSYAHFFLVDDTNANNRLDTDENLYLFELSGKDKHIRVHKIIDPQSDVIPENMASLDFSQLPESIRLDTSGEPITYTSQRQNFANWFSFHRRKEMVIKYHMGVLIDTILKSFIGMYSFNQSLISAAILIDNSENTQTPAKIQVLQSLYSYVSEGDSKLRQAYQAVGDYLDTSANSVINARSPFIQNTDGDACRQAFVIVLTDGKYNGPAPLIGNCDGDKGAPYADPYENTFADVVMHYYERDLAPGIPNTLPTSGLDISSYQHLIPLMLIFDCEILPDRYHNWSDDFLEWPKPSPETEQTLVDLFHGSINGRGFFGTAGNPSEFSDMIQKIGTQLQDSQTITSALTQVGTRIQGKNRIIEASWHPVLWTGDLNAYDTSPTDMGTRPNLIWSASNQLSKISDNQRHMFTYNGQTGIPFQTESIASSELSVEQIKTIRQSPLGAIIHSSPVIVNQQVWVGGSDGMVHGFDLNTGVEQLAYLPKMIWPRLQVLSKQHSATDYGVDGNLYAYNFNGQSLLCGTLGRGGKGVFCLNVSNIPEGNENTFAKELVLWEYLPPDDPDIGHVQQAYIVESNFNHRPVVIFGNGYNSERRQPFLYILDAQTGRPLEWNGQTIKGIALPAMGQDNALSTPALVDVNHDNAVDFIYAGDLQGNLWKFDCQSSHPNEWRVAFEEKYEKIPMPLFQARSPNGMPQPITIRPEVIRHCDSRFMGYLVMVATGKYLEKTDVDKKDTQSLYVIWDWTDYWHIQQNEDLSIVRNRYLGSLNSVMPGYPDIRKPENTPSHMAISKQDIDSLTTTETVPSVNWDPASDRPHVGWYMDLHPGSGERVIAPLTYLGANALMFVTFTPNTSSCSSSGKSRMYVINAGNAINYQELFESMSDSLSPFFQPFDGMLSGPLVSFQGGDEIILSVSSSALPGISQIMIKMGDRFEMKGLFDRQVFYWKTY